jgi:hypothetical protein
MTPPRVWRDTNGKGWLWDELPDGRIQLHISHRYIPRYVTAPVVKTTDEVNADWAIRPLVEVDPDTYQPKQP